MAVSDSEPYGKCPICGLPIVPSRIKDEAVCDSGHRFRYEYIFEAGISEPVVSVGSYVGKDAP